MTQERGKVPITRACELVAISRAGYYRRLRRAPRNDPALQDEIERIVLACPGYGYRRITAELHRRGWRVNHKPVLRIMREESWLCRVLRRRPRTTQSDHGQPVFPNRLPACEITGPDQVWVADVTYIRLERQFVFLAVILDRYSRRVIGWELSERLDVALTLGALNKALARRTVRPGLIHHSDRGIHYAARDYVAAAQQAGLQLSMSRRGCPLDNAHMESFFRTLKVEQVYLNEYRDLADARRQIGPFLEKVYNRQRLHSALGYVPPAEFEAAWQAAQEEKSAPVLRPSALLTRDPVAPAGVVYAHA